MPSILNLLGFSLKPGDCKDEYTSPAGEAFIKLVEEVLSYTLLNAQEEAKSFFQTKENGGTPPADVNKGHAFPNWLGNHDDDDTYVNLNHISIVLKDEATTYHSRDKYTKKCKIGAGLRKPDREEVAYFIVHKALQILKQYLTRGRRYPAQIFFKSVGYLFADWSAYKEPKIVADQETVKMTWLTDLAWNSTPARDDIPSMIAFNEAGSLEHNKKEFELFRSSRKELVLVVEHDVLVRKATVKKARRSRIGQAKHGWCFEVNMLDIALEVMHSVSFSCTAGDKHYVLGGHSASLHALYLIAVELRKFVSNINGGKTYKPDGETLETVVISSQVHDRISKMLIRKDRHAGRTVFRNVCCVLSSTFNDKHRDKEELFASVHTKDPESQQDLSENVNTPAQEPEDSVDPELQRREAIASAKRKKAELLEKLGNKR